MVAEETNEKMNKILRMSIKPKTSREAENVIMPESEGPECSTGREHITPMEGREISSDKPSFFACSETPHEQPEDLYTTTQINCFLQLTKGKRNVLLSSYVPDKVCQISTTH